MCSADTFGKGIQKLVLGRVVSVAIAGAIAPVLARVYSPAHFGIVAILSSVAGILSIFANFGYAQAIPLSQNRAETRALVKVCLIITFLLSLPFAFFALVEGQMIADLFGEQQMGGLAWAVPVMFVIRGLQAPGTYVLATERRFGLLSFVNFASESGPRLAQLLLACVFGASALNFLIGRFVGISLSVLIVAYVLLAVVCSKPGGKGDPAYTGKSVAKRHAQFPKVQLWNTALNRASLALPILIIGGLFGSIVAGQYSFSRCLLVLPMAILGSSLGQAFYPEAAQEWREAGTMRATIARTVRIVARIGVFPIVAAGMLGPLLYTTVFSQKWHEAGIYAQIISPWLLIILVASPVSTVFLVVRRPGSLLAYNVVLLVARPAALLLGSHLGGPRLALLCFSSISAMIWIHQFGFILKLGKTDSKGIAALLSKETLSAVILLLPAAAACWFLEMPSLSLGLLGAAVVAYMLLLFRREPGLRSRALACLRRLRGRETPQEG